VKFQHPAIRKWRAAELKERSAAQEHFIDLCRVLREPTPAGYSDKDRTLLMPKGAAGKRLTYRIARNAKVQEAPRPQVSGVAGEKAKASGQG
jgi:hypothetical protein